MLDLLDACDRLDTLAARMYSSFARDTADDSLREVFRQLEAEENEHLGWWGDARQRVESGALDRFADSAEITAYMLAILEAVELIVSADLSQLTDDERLSLAASLEFFGLDPIFAWLISVSHEALGTQRREIYGEHVGLLVTTMEGRSSWALVPHIARLRASSEAVAAGVETVLPSRSVAEHALDELCANPAHDGEPISLGILDVDVEPLAQHADALARNVLSRMVSTLVSIVRFKDLLVSLGDARFGVMFPATEAHAASALILGLAETAAGVVEDALGDGAPVASTVAVVTLPPGPDRVGGLAAFKAAEQLLRDTKAAGEPAGSLELAGSDPA